MADLAGIAEASLAVESAKEERCAVKTAGFVADNWRKKRLSRPLTISASRCLYI